MRYLETPLKEKLHIWYKFKTTSIVFPKKSTSFNQSYPKCVEWVSICCDISLLCQFLIMNLKKIKDTFLNVIINNSSIFHEILSKNRIKIILYVIERNKYKKCLIRNSLSVWYGKCPIYALVFDCKNSSIHFFGMVLTKKSF